ncbi:hypothetical protein [Candidatus Laterigemmans baculatus]|uniref:hypothetical protein n=1 Tax=Candidatus Laterigemmans baculatus TaxID=2770505 RepID=UPI0013D9237F|nr:hypothetical protein [Candidatus Laterigemmans baculatus]
MNAETNCERLQQIAEAAAAAQPATEPDGEAAVLDALAAIHDEVFAALHRNPPQSLSDLQAMLAAPRPVTVVRRSR